MSVQNGRISSTKSRHGTGDGRSFELGCGCVRVGERRREEKEGGEEGQYKPGSLEVPDCVQLTWEKDVWESSKPTFSAIQGTMLGITTSPIAYLKGVWT